MTTVVIGVGFVAMLQLLASGTATKPKTAESPPKQLALPPEQNIGETVGRGDPLVLRLRLSGRQEETEVTFLVDTGSHVTILDRSFERLLGSRLGKQRLNRVFAGRGVEQANAYTAPRLYLGNVQLLTGPTVLTCDLAAASGNNGPCEAVLGMDCLTHYCVQTDFTARKLRFLDSDDLWAPRKLERQLELLEARPECGWSYTAFRQVDRQGVPLAAERTRRFSPCQGNIFERSLIAIAANGHAAQFVAILFELEGGFNGLAILRGEGRFPCAGEIVVGGE